MCVQMPSHSPESLEDLLQFLVMGGLHHTAIRQDLDVPSQRSRHAFFLAVGVESQVSIDASTIVRSSHGPSNVRFLGTAHGPCAHDFERPGTILIHVSSLAADHDVRVSSRAYSSRVMGLAHAAAIIAIVKTRPRPRGLLPRHFRVEGTPKAPVSCQYQWRDASVTFCEIHKRQLESASSTTRRPINGPWYFRSFKQHMSCGF